MTACRMSRISLSMQEQGTEQMLLNTLKNPCHDPGLAGGLRYQGWGTTRAAPP